MDRRSFFTIGIAAASSLVLPWKGVLANNGPGVLQQRIWRLESRISFLLFERIVDSGLLPSNCVAVWSHFSEPFKSDPNEIHPSGVWQRNLEILVQSPALPDTVEVNTVVSNELIEKYRDDTVTEHMFTDHAHQAVVSFLKNEGRI